MTTLPDGVREAPWDARVLGRKAFEITRLSPSVLDWLSVQKGFFTLKVPSGSKKPCCEEFGFYYCDTLLEPRCTQERFIAHEKKECSLSQDFYPEEVFSLVYDGFIHDRFHKDKAIPTDVADTRYVNWLRDLHDQGRLWAFYWKYSELAGFWSCDASGKIVLHALSKAFRGKGLAKYFWTRGCQELFRMGFEVLRSSVSASNLGALNLYCSLGFSLGEATDVYHLFR